MSFSRFAINYVEIDDRSKISRNARQVAQDTIVTNTSNSLDSVT